MKQKKCKSCKALFTPVRSMQAVCSPLCGLEIAKAKREKAAKQAQAKDRRETKEKLEKFKKRGDYMRDAQIAFNLFIKLRDRELNLPCISSGRSLDWSGNKTDAGHFRSVGSAPHMRFVELNVHAQSKHDNQFLSGNAIEYRKGLIARIGLEAVEALESDQTPRHYSIDDLKEIAKTYRAKAREIAKRNGW